LREVDVSRDILQKFVEEMRILCKRFLTQNPIRLGGNFKICQVDESLFRYKPKNHRGRASFNDLWVFGIVDTSCNPAKIYLELVSDRSAETLLPILD
jgi:hypothetical protein